MAKFEIKAGAKADLLSPDEYYQGIRDLGRKLDQRLAKPSRLWVPCNEISTDASGNLGGGYGGLGAVLWTCPNDFSADVHRAVVEIAGYVDPATPLTTGSWKMYRGAAQSYASVGWLAPTGGSVSPVTYVEGEGAPVLRPGEQLVIAGAGLPTSRQVFVVILVQLFPTGDQPAGTVIVQG